jgi:glycosyltransferase involved in cell wall biosynthesis
MAMLGAPPERVFAAPFGLDIDFWSADAPVPVVDPDRPTSVLFAGSLTKRKGLDVLITALDDPRLRGVPLEIVGVGPEEARFTRMARERGVTASFLGHMDREPLRDRYRAADIFVLPSRSDPWGLVLNEAMGAACVPITTTAVGSVDDLIETGVNGFVVPPDDPVALRNALIALVEDPHRRVRLAKAARTHALDFTPERGARGFVDAIEALGR